MNRFRPHEHLRRPEDFKRVYDHKRSVADDVLILYGRPNGLPHSRIGFSVAKKWGGAVKRVRMKRLFREAYRLSKPDVPTGLDLILLPRRVPLPPLKQLQPGLARLLRQLARKLTREAGVS